MSNLQLNIIKIMKNKENPNRYKNYYLLLILQFLFFISCSPIRYMSDHLEPNTEPITGSYSIEGECEKGVSSIYKIRVSNAIHSFMTNEGFHISESPDILIQFFLKERTNSYLTSECNYYTRWGKGEYCELRTIEYEEGSIIIDFIDTDSQTIVWHGVIKSPAFDYIKNPNDKINKYVNKLLKQYYNKNNN